MYSAMTLDFPLPSGPITATKSAGGLIQFLILRGHDSEGVFAGSSLKKVLRKDSKEVHRWENPGGMISIRTIV
jgi:hypothetical protein